MSGDMKKVTRYLCKWCGREFRTPDRHDCKWNPGKRNCLSCVHQCGTFSVEEDAGDGFQTAIFPYFQCDVLGKDESDSTNNLTEIHLNEWKGCCDSYETVPGYKGKETFKERRLEIERRAACAAHGCGQ